MGIKLSFSGFEDLERKLTKAANQTQTGLKCPNCGRDLGLSIGDLGQPSSKACPCGAEIRIEPTT